MEPLLILVPGVKFVMGSDAGQEDEAPPHTVELAPFYLGRCAVTNREYALFLRESGIAAPVCWNDPRFNHPDQPVVAVNWFEAAAYCEWLGRQQGKRYRLPTEAERELACRGGTTTAYPWGETAERETGAYGRRWLEGGPELVGGPTNAFGFCNLADNVHEWCLDWYGKDYYRTSPESNPKGPPSGRRKASRGGSWRHQIKVTRCSARSSLDPTFRYTDYGFRLALSED